MCTKRPYAANPNLRRPFDLLDVTILLVWSIAVLCLFGCGAAAPGVSYTQGQALVDPRANAEVWAFEAAWGFQITGVQVQFVWDVPLLEGASEDSVGLCTLQGNTRHVALDIDYWLQRPACREALVFHELGHCVLGLDHTDSTDDTGRPVSVMHSRVSSVCPHWAAHRTDYLEGLFP